MARRGIGPLVAALVLARSASADCTKDTECKGDRICVDGRCVAPPAQACTKDDDCPGDLVCAVGKCAPDPEQAAPAPTTPTTPPAAEAERYPVHFEGDGHHVEMGGLACTSPCTLRLAAGS